LDIDITRIRDDKTLDCYESVYATVATLYGRDYEMLFVGKWGFQCNPATEDDRLSSRINVDIFDDDEWLEKYVGLKHQVHYVESHETLLMEIKKEMRENRAVALAIDSIDCKWHPFYQIQSSQHFFTATYSAADQIVCADPFSSDKLQYLNEETIGKIKLHYDTFYPCEPVEVDWKYIIRIGLGHVTSDRGGGNVFDNIRYFSELIKLNNRIEDECESYPIAAGAPLFFKLEIIANNRYNYSRILRALSIRFGVSELVDIASEFVELSKKWLVVRMMFLKAKYSKNNFRDRISNTVYEIANSEEQVAYKLEKLI